MQPSRPPPLSPLFRQLTVLCVDDDSVGLLVRKTLLEKAGYDVLSAVNADDALRIFNTNRIDVVVSDHLLPGATGADLARVMKHLKPETPILLLSGVVDVPPGTQHVNKFITKTDGPEKLLQAIAEVTTANAPIRPRAPFLVKRSPPPQPEEAEQCAATIAHEINNPLDSLSNLLFLAEGDAGLSYKTHTYLALAREEVNRIGQIAQAALRDCRDEERRESADVPQLLWSVIEFYKARFEARGISVETRGCRGGNLAVYVNPLRQLFSNLFLNAVDAMANGGRLRARVSEACEWSGKHRYGLRVTVADDGSGISRQNLHRIFDPFFTTKGAHGTGLGLFLVMKVVRKHEGSLHVRSSTERGHSGTVFSIFLPAAQG